MSELFYPHGGGAELATYLYARLLSERDFKVAVVTNKFNNEPSVWKARNLVIYRLPLFNSIRSVKFSILRRMDVLLSSLIRELVKWADIVYIPRFWYGAVVLAKAYGKPAVVHLHDYTLVCPLANLFDMTKGISHCRKSFLCSQGCIYAYEKVNNRSFKELLESMLLNSTLGKLYSKVIFFSDAVVCVSYAQRDLLLQNSTVLPSKVHVVYNPLPEQVEVNLTSQTEDFGYFGGPSYLKGFHVLFKAAALVKKVKSIKIHATKFSGVTKKSYLLRKLGIITYGKLDGRSYRKLYTELRAIIVPSIWEEPLPYVVSEALINKKIVIASRVGGIPEQVSGCKGAFLIKAGDHRALAEKILHVTSLSDEEAHDLGAKNREFILKKFSNEKIADQFSSLLEKLSTKG